MEGIDRFKETIKAYLNKRAECDEVNIDLLVAYIASCVRELKRTAFTDDEIYQIAVHYVDEEGNVKVDFNAVKELSCVVSPGELTEEDRERAKRQAIEELKREEMDRLKRKPSNVSNDKKIVDNIQQLELF